MKQPHIYAVTGAPLSSGRPHFTRTVVEVRWEKEGGSGAPGTSGSVAAVTGSDQGPQPWRFSALTLNQYGCPGLSPSSCPQ